MVNAPSLSDDARREELQAKLHLLASEQQERLAEHRANELGLPYVNLSVFPVDAQVLEIVPKTQETKAQAVLFYKQGKDIRLGAVDPEASLVQDLVQKLTAGFGAMPQLYVVSSRGLVSALARYQRDHVEADVPRGEVQVEQEDVSLVQKTLSNLKDLGARITSLPPTEVLNAIVVGAVAVRSSDVHIEPLEGKARLRYRIDGVFQDVTTFDRQGWALMLSRVKVLSKLKLNVKDRPQDGSFVLKVGDDAIYDLRVSVLPGAYGENIVMRILDRKSESVAIADLGMKSRDKFLVEEELKRTNGMILVTGPTGSGKTTTLSSFIREVNRDEIKIITLEDPIEYRLPGVEQTQIDESAGYTFAKGLRSILRQDPDMILVGEMRDAETVEVAVHASLTGHLVFSTLHTNNAAGAIPRLVDMGVKPFVLAPALNMIIAQRLVRVVCTQCAKEYAPDAALLGRIKDAMRGVRADVFNPAVLSDKSLVFYEAVGCDACGQTGYKGRKGVFEVFRVDDAMKKLLLKGADTLSIQELALAQGMTTISQDAYLKVIDGTTTIEEVERVSEE